MQLKSHKPFRPGSQYDISTNITRTVSEDAYNTGSTRRSSTMFFFFKLGLFLCIGQLKSRCHKQANHKPPLPSCFADVWNRKYLFCTCVGVYVQALCFRLCLASFASSKSETVSTVLISCDIKSWLLSSKAVFLRVKLKRGF